MGKSQKEIEYVEEDGFVLHRPEGDLYIYGEASAYYERTYTPGTRWDPPDDERERVGRMVVDITSITDEDGEEVTVELTDEENSMWEDHMSAMLDDAADDECDWE